MYKKTVLSRDNFTIYLRNKILKMLRLIYISSFNLWDWLIAIFISLVGYLSPLKEIAHMMLFFFLVDVIYGWLADRKLNNGEIDPETRQIIRVKFQPNKVWNKTVPRIILSIILLICAFMLDTNTDQEYVSIYKIGGWVISSLLIVSIAKNGYIVTKWEAIPFLGKMLQKKFNDQTGMEINDENIT